jgi:hypothetical protein
MGRVRSFDLINYILVQAIIEIELKLINYQIEFNLKLQQSSEFLYQIK